MQKLAIAAAILLLPVSLNAQWLDWRTPDIPRTADGKPNLTAPTPRTSTGKPDFSGIWQPELNPYRFSVILDLKDEVIFRPAAEAIFQGRVKDYRREDPVTNCLPAGPSEPINVMYRIIQAPSLIAMLFESGTGRYRQIHMDGRQLPEDPNPSWLGYSIGRWEATRWSSNQQASMTGPGSIDQGTLTLKNSASPRSCVALISDTCSIRSLTTIPRC